jgi:hypothetical protein
MCVRIVCVTKEALQLCAQRKMGKFSLFMTFNLFFYSYRIIVMCNAFVVAIFYARNVLRSLASLKLAARSRCVVRKPGGGEKNVIIYKYECTP